MAKHEFGLMDNTPQRGKRYDEYEPQKYNCISVDDKYIETIDTALSGIDFYWHTLDVCGKGLAYCGVTLMPPESLRECISAFKGKCELAELTNLFEKAVAKNKWIIHFGL